MYVISIPSIHRRNLSRSLAPYLADPDARVRLAVVEAAGPIFFQRGWGWHAFIGGFYGWFNGFYGDFMVIHGILWWFQGDSMGFYGDFMVIRWDFMVILWWFYGDLRYFWRRFHGDSMGFYGDLRDFMVISWWLYIYIYIHTIIHPSCIGNTYIS